MDPSCESADRAHRRIDLTIEMSTLPARWVGIGDSRALSQLLVAQFGRTDRLARWRYTVKLVLTPHLAVGSSAVIGMVPEPKLIRFWWAVMWPLFGQGRPFDRRRFPWGIMPVCTEWRVINFAADPGGGRGGAGTAVALSRLLLSVADAHRIVLLAAARTDDKRLERAYARHGFVRVEPTPVRPKKRSVMTIEMKRHPLSESRNTPRRNVLRTGRTDRAFAQFVFGPDWERPGSVLLDLGAGDSSLADDLHQLGWHTVTLDRDYARIRPAHDQFAVAGDCAALPFPDETFDVVVAVWVLLHVDDVDVCVREIGRVLRPTGVLLLHPLWSSGARLRRIARIPGVTVRPGRVIRRRCRPCASVDAAAFDAWDADQRAAFLRALRPNGTVRVLGQFATDVIVRTTGDHRRGSRGGGHRWQPRT
ncbi:class I SAM-dependent methyltransferase [Nocardia fluminea]|uniref:class I SAM-dependent methyltransferase n=1 Tax=Nocardia fluminea TaxID=134984 RepID=UPI00365A6A96